MIISCAGSQQKGILNLKPQYRHQIEDTTVTQVVIFWTTVQVLLFCH